MNTAMSMIRPELTQFAAKYGISGEQLREGAMTVDTVANDPAESFLPQVVERIAVTYAKTNEMSKTDPDDTTAIDAVQKEAAAFLESKPESMKLNGEIMRDAESLFGTAPLPGAYNSGEAGIFAVDMYQIDWSRSSGLFGVKLGEVVVDTTPGQDGLVYYIHQTGTPDSSAGISF